MTKLADVNHHTWVLEPRSATPPRLRLFCLPYAGGGAAAYARWAELLPSEVALCRVQLPGRENRWREEPFVRLTLLVETLATALQPYLDVPFAFFGHSLGALTSFELARQVRRQFALSPAHLFVSGRWAPHWPDPEPPIYQRPDAELIAALRERYDSIPDIVLNDPDLLALFLPLLRADMTLLDTYCYSAERPLDCPITAYGGNADRRVTRAALEGWHEHTSQAFHLQMFPGAHFYLQAGRVPLLQALSQELTMSLNKR